MGVEINTLLVEVLNELKYKKNRMYCSIGWYCKLINKAFNMICNQKWSHILLD